MDDWWWVESFEAWKSENCFVWTVAPWCVLIFCPFAGGGKWRFGSIPTCEWFQTGDRWANFPCRALWRRRRRSDELWPSTRARNNLRRSHRWVTYYYLWSGRSNAPLRPATSHGHLVTEMQIACAAAAFDSHGGSDVVDGFLRCDWKVMNTLWGALIFITLWFIGMLVYVKTSILPRSN